MLNLLANDNESDGDQYCSDEEVEKLNFLAQKAARKQQNPRRNVKDGCIERQMQLARRQVQLKKMQDMKAAILQNMPIPTEEKEDGDQTNIGS